MIAGLTEAPADFEAVHPRHGDVQHDGVGGAFGMGTERSRPVLGQLGLIPLEPKGTIERLADSRFVVDHQDSHPSSLAGSR